MFVFRSGLKSRLQSQGMAGDESEKDVFNCAELAITAAWCFIQAGPYRTACTSVNGSLPHRFPSANPNCNNEFNWASKLQSVKFTTAHDCNQLACVNAWDVMIITHAPPLQGQHTHRFTTLRELTQPSLADACLYSSLPSGHKGDGELSRGHWGFSIGKNLITKVSSSTLICYTAAINNPLLRAQVDSIISHHGKPQLLIRNDCFDLVLTSRQPLNWRGHEPAWEVTQLFS